MRPFSCGTQSMDWEAANCERCTKGTFYDDGRMPDKCDIQNALAEAAISDGEISDEIADRMTRAEGSYNWPCGEVEWSEAWKGEYMKRALEPHPEPAPPRLATTESARGVWVSEE